MIELPSNILFTQVTKDAPTLTDCEFEVLHMVLSGYSNADITKNIEKTNHGVKWRLTRLYNKFNVRNRVELIKLANSTGLKFRNTKGIAQTYAVRIEAVNNG